MIVFREKAYGQVFESLDLVFTFLKECEWEEGDYFEIEALEMTQSEFDALPVT